MGGIGDRVTPLSDPLPPLFGIIANPLANVPADKTARVFRDLALSAAAARREDVRPAIKDRAALIALMRQRGNALARAAQAIVPEMTSVSTPWNRTRRRDRRRCQAQGPPALPYSRAKPPQSWPPSG